MPQQPRPAEGGDVRCTRCGVAVEGTRHTRSGWIVGHYVLHTGSTEEATLRRRDDETPIVYQRLVDPVQIVSCPSCFTSPEMRRLWLRFGEQEKAA